MKGYQRLAIGIAGVFAVIFWGSIIYYIFNSSLTSQSTVANDSDMVNELNNEGLIYMDEGKYEEAKNCFLEALEYATQDTSFDQSENLSATYNNLCYAYYWIGDYDQSLEYGDEALAIGFNDSIEYSNYANTLYSLYRPEEAMEYYDMAISLDPNALYAYYGKGNIYYDNGDYEQAREMYIKYLEFEPDDLDAKIDLVYCNTYLGNYDKALTLVDKLIEENSGNLDLFVAKGEVLEQSKGYEEAEDFYQTTAALFPDNVDVQMMYATFCYDNEKYELALAEFLNISKDFVANDEVDKWVINCYSSMEDMEGAEAYYKHAQRVRNTYELNTAMGDFYYYESMYMEAIQCYDRAIVLKPDYLEGYTNKLYAMFYGKRYTSCIETAQEVVKEFPDAYEIPYLIGEAYYYLCDYENAVDFYKKAMELNQEDDNIVAYIADAYLMLQDYEKAEYYADQALAMYSENTTALGVKETVTVRQSPITDQLKDFIRDNYLYYGIDDEESSIEEALSKEDMSNLEISQAIDAMKQKDDIFTYTISDGEYDLYMGEAMNEVEFTYTDDIIYLRIYTFSENTYNKVVESLDKISDSDNKTLVIDLRGNGGGLTQGANDILDCLLPECVTSTLIYRDGYTYSYYSDASQIEFHKIFVFVDDYTASASELLTLGLDSYLDNVTIIGRDTFGKGVGQIVFEDSERKLAVCLVNHYWNVKQQNIMNGSIKPDIYIESDNLEDYMAAVKENQE